jgi:hypothetical protein
MVFCGHCGYQLAPGDKNCPRCGAQADVDLIEQDPGTYHPTEISHAIIDQAPTQAVPPPRQMGQNWPEPQAGPLILGPVNQNEELANETTTMMGAQTYAPQSAYPAYPGYAQPAGYGYGTAGYPAYQTGQADAIAELLEASRKGKITALLLIPFGILMPIAAIIVFLLTKQGIIFV